MPHALAPTLIVHGGMLIDGLGAPPRRADVLIGQDKILEIRSPGEQTTLTADIPRLDATGMTVMPGLIDAHCHISFDEPNSNDELFFHRREGLTAIIAAVNVQKLLAAGVTGFLDADSLYDTGIDLRDAIEAGIVKGPRMSTGGNALLTSVGGTAGRLIPDHGRCGYGKVVNGRDEIVQEVRRQIKMGVDWIKVHVTGLTPRQRTKGEVQVWSYAEMRLVVETAHELGTPVVGHCRGASSTRDAARAGFDMILHATYMDEEALEAVITSRVPIVPTFTFQANLADYGALTGASPEIRALFQKEIVESAEMLRRAYDAGVPLLCGTESGFSLTPYGDWHYRELEVFVRDLGMTPLQAIACATSANAAALRMSGEVGALCAGYLADLLVVDGDVSRDVTLLGAPERLRHVILGGAVIERAAPPRRRDPPGWRTSHYGRQILRRADVREAIATTRAEKQPL